MKESLLPKDASGIDKYIDQYCRSVEDLLRRVEEKSVKIKHKAIPAEEFHAIDDTDELIEY